MQSKCSQYIGHFMRFRHWLSAKPSAGIISVAGAVGQNENEPHGQHALFEFHFLLPSTRTPASRSKSPAAPVSTHAKIISRCRWWTHRIADTQPRAGSVLDISCCWNLTQCLYQMLTGTSCSVCSCPLMRRSTESASEFCAACNGGPCGWILLLPTFMI
jgi:hypothetical protein